MKRFVTYLYEYERGSKTRNVGFIRVDIRGSVVNMEISVRKLRVPNGKAKVLGIVIFDGLQSLEFGEMQVLDGQGDVRLQLPARNIQGKPVSIDDVVGIGMQFEGGSYIASCWKDEYAEAMARCEYRPWEDIMRKKISIVAEQNMTSDVKIEEQKCEIVKNRIEPVRVFSEKEVQQIDNDSEIEVAEIKDKDLVNANSQSSTDIQETQQVQPNPENGNSKGTMLPQYCYRKLDLTHMHILPMQDRHYSSNAFLVHGFWNYGYVVLKTEMAGDKKKSWLGVPGIYERPEAAMALAFGFPLFEAIPAEMVEAPLNVEKCFSEKEMRARNFSPKDAKGTLKNQPSNEKLFGCWFVELHI